MDACPFLVPGPSGPGRGRPWFDRLVIGRQVGDRLEPVAIDEVASAGKRWWDAMYAGDARVTDAGIYPLKGWTRLTAAIAN